MLRIIRRIALKVSGFHWRKKSTEHAVLLGITAAFCYSTMMFLAKFMSDYTTESMIVFFRFGVSLLWVVSVFGYKYLRGKSFSFKTRHFGLHILRAFSGFVAIFFLYVSLKYVPLVNANLLAMTYTLFIPLLSFIFLDTKTSVKNWLALGSGVIGIIFILKPCSSAFHPALLLALIAGLAIAISFLGVHELAKEDDLYTIMAYYFPVTFILSGILNLFNWRTPDLFTVFMLVLIGITGTVYQELLTRALMYATPKIVSPLLYFSVVFSGFLGWLFWGYIPDLFFLIGMVLVIFGCIFSIIYARKTLPPAP